MLIERLFMLAAVEQAGIGRMTDAATPADAGNPWRRRRMVAVAGVASWRAEIAAVEQGVTVDASAIFGQLSRWQR